MGCKLIGAEHELSGRFVSGVSESSTERVPIRSISRLDHCIALSAESIVAEVLLLEPHFKVSKGLTGS